MLKQGRLSISAKAATTKKEENPMVLCNLKAKVTSGRYKDQSMEIIIGQKREDHKILINGREIKNCTDLKLEINVKRKGIPELTLKLLGK